MVYTTSTNEFQIQVLDGLRLILDKAEDRNLLAKAFYKWYVQKNVSVTKRFNEGDIFFLDRPKNEPKTAKTRDKQIEKSKTLTKATGPSRIIRA